MKPHIVVTIAPGVPAPPAPHWSEIIRDKRSAPERLLPAVDALLRRFGLPVWVAKGYRAASEEWSGVEIASGFDRVYLLVLQRDRVIPHALIAALGALPGVAKARAGAVVGVPLPRARAQTIALMSASLPSLPVAKMVRRSTPVGTHGLSAKRCC